MEYTFISIVCLLFGTLHIATGEPIRGCSGVSGNYFIGDRENPCIYYWCEDGNFLQWVFPCSYGTAVPYGYFGQIVPCIDNRMSCPGGAPKAAIIRDPEVDDRVHYRTTTPGYPYNLDDDTPSLYHKSKHDIQPKMHNWNGDRSKNNRENEDNMDESIVDNPMSKGGSSTTTSVPYGSSTFLHDMGMSSTTASTPNPRVDAARTTTTTTSRDVPSTSPGLFFSSLIPTGTHNPSTGSNARNNIHGQSENDIDAAPKHKVLPSVKGSEPELGLMRKVIDRRGSNPDKSNGISNNGDFEKPEPTTKESDNSTPSTRATLPTVQVIVRRTTKSTTTTPSTTTSTTTTTPPRTTPTATPTTTTTTTQRPTTTTQRPTTTTLATTTTTRATTSTTRATTSTTSATTSTTSATTSTTNATTTSVEEDEFDFGFESQASSSDQQPPESLPRIIDHGVGDHDKTETTTTTSTTRPTTPSTTTRVIPEFLKTTKPTTVNVPEFLRTTKPTTVNVPEFLRTTKPTTVNVPEFLRTTTPTTTNVPKFLRTTKPTTMSTEKEEPFLPEFLKTTEATTLSTKKEDTFLPEFLRTTKPTTVPTPTEDPFLPEFLRTKATRVTPPTTSSTTTTTPSTTIRTTTQEAKGKSESESCDEKMPMRGGGQVITAVYPQRHISGGERRSNFTFQIGVIHVTLEIKMASMCYLACDLHADCAGFDWDIKDASCWFHTEERECNSEVSFMGGAIAHYRLEACGNFSGPQPKKPGQSSDEASRPPIDTGTDDEVDQFVSELLSSESGTEFVNELLQPDNLQADETAVRVQADESLYNDFQTSRDRIFHMIMDYTNRKTPETDSEWERGS